MKISLFSPFANIWEHSYPEALLLGGLEQKGWEVSVLGCKGIFGSHCVAMSAASIDEDSSQSVKKRTCSACINRRNLITKEFSFTTDFLEDWIFESDEKHISEILDKTTPENWTEIRIDGSELGKYAVYEMWLNHKLVSTQLPDELWPLYIGQLTNTLRAYFGGINYLSQQKPDAVIVYNDRYSVHHAFCQAAEKLGIPSYMVHGGWHIVRRSESLAMFASGTNMNDVFESEGWVKARSQPLSEELVSLVGEHFQGLWDASSAFAYSSGLEGTSATALRQKFSINEDKKVLLATMSSLDEIMGAQLIGYAPEDTNSESLFKDQLAWVEHLVTFAQAHPEVHIILRLHPRMFPNKRELKMSPVVEGILKFSQNGPSNLSFNVPSDNVGIYDLAQIVDVTLNYSSSVGLELMALGIPVVVPKSSYFFTYPNELNSVGNSLSEYDRLILEKTMEGWSIENSRRAFRWFAFLFSRVSVGFSETVSARPISIRPQKPGFRLWLWKKLVYLLLQYGPMLRERIALRRKSLPSGSVAIFDDSLRQQFKTISDSLLFPDLYDSPSNETKALEQFFENLTNNEWSGVKERNSLAGRVKTYLLEQN